MEIFALGFVAGLVTLMTTVLTTVSALEKAEKDEKFVFVLIEEMGWDNSAFELKTTYSSKYMRIWKRLRRKYIENGNYKN